MATVTDPQALRLMSKEDVRYALGSLVRAATLVKLRALGKCLSLPVTTKLKKAETQEIMCTYLDRALSECTERELERVISSFIQHLHTGTLDSLRARAASSIAAARALPVQAPASAARISNPVLPGQANVGRMSIPDSVQQVYSQVQVQMPRQEIAAPNHLSFYASAFYRRHSLIAPIKLWQPPYPQDRSKRDSLSFSLSEQAQNFLKEDLHEVYLCAQEYQGATRMYIKFPNAFSATLDNLAIQPAFQGHKKAPMSAKPIALPKNVLLDPKRSYHRLDLYMGISHNVARDDNSRLKSFAFGLYTVKIFSSEEVIQIIRDKPCIPPEDTIAQIVENMKADAEGDESPADLGVVESVYSLKDRISCCRIDIPVRSSMCSHIDCFDLATYVELQKQAETCKCPICGSDIHWESIRIDGYFVDLLTKVGENVESVNIQTDGSWTIKSYDDTSDESSDDGSRPAKKRKSSRVEVIDLDSDLGSDADETNLNTETSNDTSAEQSHDSLDDLDLAGLSDVTEPLSNAGSPEEGSSQHANDSGGTANGNANGTSNAQDYAIGFHPNGAREAEEQSILFSQLGNLSPSNPIEMGAETSLADLLRFRISNSQTQHLPTPPTSEVPAAQSSRAGTGSAAEAIPAGRLQRAYAPPSRLLSQHNKAMQLARERARPRVTNHEIVDLTGDSD